MVANDICGHKGPQVPLCFFEDVRTAVIHCTQVVPLGSGNRSSSGGASGVSSIAPEVPGPASEVLTEHSEGAYGGDQQRSSNHSAECIGSVNEVFLSVERDAARQLAQLLVDTDPRSQSSSRTDTCPGSPHESLSEAVFPSRPNLQTISLGGSISLSASYVSARVSPGHRLRDLRDDGTASKASADSSDFLGRSLSSDAGP